MIPKGSTPIKNDILIDIFAKGKLSKIEMQIVFYIIRWSWGFNGTERRQDWTKILKKRQIAKDIRLGESKVGRVLNIMIKEEKIIEKDGCYQFNEHHEKWKINNTKSDISKALRDRILERDNYTCQYCGKSRWKDEVKLEVDHIIPISKGGTDDINNLTTSCRKCNRKKMNRILKVDEKTSNNKVDEKTSSGCQKDKFRLSKRQVKVDEKTSSTAKNPIQNKPLPDPKETNKETNTKETLKKTSHTFEKCEVVYQLTIYLEGKIMENNKAVNKRTEIQLQSWCKDMDKLLRIDKANPDDVKQIIDWVVTDDFWSPNIMSAAKLRKHYPRFYKKVITNTTHDPNRFDFINEEENQIE